jgi:hypothetical protein
MPRKSQKLRLSQTEQLFASYEGVGLTSDYRCRFIQDMLVRLERGKGLSKKQRDWLDSLIDEGVPEPENAERVAEITAAANLDGMQHKRDILLDFAGKVHRGWTLSEKQENWLGGMLAEAERIRREGKFRPDDIEKLHNAIDLLAGKNDWYWGHRPGTYKAYTKIKEWLDWTHATAAADILKAKGLPTGRGEEPLIDEWSCNKALKAVKNQLSMLDESPHPVGSMRYLQGESVMMIGPPCVSSHDVMQEVLVAGEVRLVRVSSIKKRR